jgi:hypothetical protein
MMKRRGFISCVIGIPAALNTELNNTCIIQPFSVKLW